ncbi:MAG TPA: N-acetylmuramoyl-L-alanine amidase [Bacteroides mediterraneensis]|uniref:N-acetylmuramoyl-L-alanine amidase family protein n=1 Tax=Bacteroides mediterraneensis TaxID=1841856 RepID=UPI0026EDEF15|nr:N-acetylmuramoyl-L-alanine amidase [Bacteroides mediterraneensis]HJH65493.1 N-acetylmuramoyl-L-alanine amidase [Bacteroides mediterraneensis]
MQRRKFDILFIAVSLLLAFSSFPQTHAAETRFTVVIDAGHGGNDPGAIGRRGKEKNINLSVALKLGRLIRQNCPDTRVVYTRERDVFVPLHRRAEIANDAKADLFISIHTNSVASRNRSVSGTETYTLGLHRTQENLEVAKKENAVILIEDDYKQRYAGFNPNSSESYIIFEFLQDKNMAQSVSFATSVQKCFRNANRTDKGVHQAGFLVLRATSMPSVLIELGYITNPTEEAYLMSEQGSSTLAKSIYRAFLNYKGGKVSSAQLAAEPESMPTPAEEETAAAPQPQAQAVRTQAPPKQDMAAASVAGKPVFKIQILTSDRKLPSRSKLFKGLSPVDSYRENGIIKYTYGADTNYNKILRLKRNKVDSKFKDAFIIAFKDGQKVNINQAIREFKRNR